MRPRFHLAPTTGWMSDPNGLVDRGGVHHAFFQHHPDAPTFGRMRWGHATSTDLLTWEHHPTALAPGPPGSPDADGCWSGVAVALPGGRLAALYTGLAGGRTLPCRAVAQDDDLLHWRADPRPVVPAWPVLQPALTDLRDHAVARTADSARWRQVVAAGTAGAPGGGRLLSWLSEDDDLSAWSFEGVVLDAASAGLPGQVWECPDVSAPEGAGDGTVLVLLSWYDAPAAGAPPTSSGVLWVTGSLEGGRFVPDRTGRLDLGDRLYAPQSWTAGDGRRLLLGWLRTQDDPASAGRAAVGAQSLPRHLRLVGGRLHQAPAAEVDALPRGEALELPPGGAVDLPDAAGALEVLVEGGGATTARLRLTGPDGAALDVDLRPFATPSARARAGSTWADEPPATTSVRVLVDAGLVEAFGDDGRAAAWSGLAVERVARVELLAGAASAAGGSARARVRVLAG